MSNKVNLKANIKTVKQIPVDYGSSPRGLRDGDKRPSSYSIKIDGEFDYVELARLTNYLSQLLTSLEFPIKN